MSAHLSEHLLPLCLPVEPLATQARHRALGHRVLDVMGEVLVQHVRGGRDGTREAGNAVLLLRPFDPPCELRVRVGYDLRDLRRTDVGRGDKQRE